MLEEEAPSVFNSKIFAKNKKIVDKIKRKKAKSANLQKRLP
jgi:hypothetical protein